MTKFDYIVIGLVALSAFVGFARGAAREVAAVVALFGASAAAIFGLKWSLPIAARFAHPSWLAALCALLVVFVLVYLVLRLTGAHLASRLHGSDVLGALDRTIGLLIGLVRGVVVLGALYLMFNAATPADLRPAWIINARSWPVAAQMGGALEALAPRGLDVANRLKAAFKPKPRATAPRDRKATEGYDARRTRETDDLVEKSR